MTISLVFVLSCFVPEFSGPGIMSSPSSKNAGDDAWLMKIEMKREELGEINEGDKIKKVVEDQVPVAEEEDILQLYYSHLTLLKLKLSRSLN